MKIALCQMRMSVNMEEDPTKRRHAGTWQATGTPIICAMGAGNELDPTAFRVSDISSTQSGQKKGKL